VETAVAPSVEIPVGSLEIRMLGPLLLQREGADVPLPKSRKVRALLAYLALEARPVPRSRLCELLWDVPSDPRGELRWCLTKIRSLIDEPNRQRVISVADSVSLDLTGCFLDAIETDRAIDSIDTATVERLQTLAALFSGDLLEGLEIDDSPAFSSWLAAQRRRFHDHHALLLERIVRHTAGDESLPYLEKWLQVAPFDLRAHALLFEALARRDRIRDAEEHLAVTEGLFDAEGLDCTPLRDAWHDALQSHDAPAPSEESAVLGRRASVAVMPFDDESAVADVRGGTADALAHDVITRLAKLRSLFVIAQGTMFALHERGITAREIGKMLNVDYVVSGSVRRTQRKLAVTVELVETRTARIVWAGDFDCIVDDAFEVLEEIGNKIVATVASEIELSERNRAILRPPNSLDAWEAHHRGLWHAYRFNEADNDQARRFFELSVRLDPTFSSAYAGLSFTYFQDAFQGWAERKPAVQLAYETAGKAIMVDDRDPTAHLAIGRALWLLGSFDDSVTELERSIELSPSFALGHYSLGFVQSQAGDPEAAIVAVDHSRRLSPFDPLLFGMYGSRAMALIRLGHVDEAADDAIRAAGRPNAHAHILAIAALSLALAGRIEEARSYVTAIRKTLPSYCVDDFLTAMRFPSVDDAQRFRIGAARIGMG